MNSVYTDSAEIKELLTQIPENKIYSDLVDSEGHQYVDLVQEGGGVLGIALVGYTYIMERAGIRFFSLAGTSAGAINTMLLAGLGDLNEAKSEKVLDILSKTDLFDFVDGDKVVKKLINKAIKKEGGIVWLAVWNVIKLYKILRDKIGLNPGKYFKHWLDHHLENNGINQLWDLKELRKKLPEGLKIRGQESDINNIEAKLAIITSDITTHTKAEFPRMSGLYWDEPDTIQPSKLVRASMSIPFFFEPFVAKDIPNHGQTESKEWKKLARYNGPVPQNAKFVDGGMLSNFPINVFHLKEGQKPIKPTFGARLSTYRENYSKAASFFGFCGAMVSTMRQVYDYDFLLRNPDYSQLICKIDANEDFNWLDFNMDEPKKIKLFNLGAEKAVKFLNDFDWEKYKSIR